MKLLKLTQKGLAHYVVPLAVVVLVAVGGTAYLVASHAATPSYNQVLSTGQTLLTGQEIVSQTSQGYDGYGQLNPAPGTAVDLKLVMQTDGNLVLYSAASVPIWSTATNGTGSNNRLVMQTDGNLVVYTSAGKAVWSSKTNGTGTSNRLEVQADGNLVVYTSAGKAVWASGTAQITTAHSALPWNYNSTGIGHASGSACNVYNSSRQSYGTWWCSDANSATAGRTMWYGPGLTLSGKNYYTNPQVALSWVNSSGEFIKGWPSGASFYWSVTDAQNRYTLFEQRLDNTSGPHYCPPSTQCPLLGFSLYDEPINNYQINIFNVVSPADSGDRLAVEFTAY